MAKRNKMKHECTPTLKCYIRLTRLHFELSSPVLSGAHRVHTAYLLKCDDEMLLKFAIFRCCCCAVVAVVVDWCWLNNYNQWLFYTTLWPWHFQGTTSRRWRRERWKWRKKKLLCSTWLLLLLLLRVQKSFFVLSFSGESRISCALHQRFQSAKTALLHMFCFVFVRFHAIKNHLDYWIVFVAPRRTPAARNDSECE